MNLAKYLFLCLILVSNFGFSQNKETKKTEEVKSVKKETGTENINPLSPAKAAFYSALVPGLGQAYNKKYWKIPVIYVALGAGLYIALDNDTKYNNFRTEYKNRVQGINNPNDEYFSRLTDESILRGQRLYQKNRDLAILITAGLYMLNIIDANVDAHLMQFNVNDKLTFQPSIQPNSLNYSLSYGMSLSYNF